jgi:HSP90 family molecular chaperone
MNEYFIRGNVPSLKNSKQWTGRYLISSKRVLEYEKETKHQYETLAPLLIADLMKVEKPYRISFRFIRGSKHKFDYINAVQLPLDLFVKQGILVDDNADEVIPVFQPYEYNKLCPGVFIEILHDNEEYNVN